MSSKLSKDKIELITKLPIKKEYIQRLEILGKFVQQIPTEVLLEGTTQFFNHLKTTSEMKQRQKIKINDTRLKLVTDSIEKYNKKIEEEEVKEEFSREKIDYYNEMIEIKYRELKEMENEYGGFTDNVFKNSKRFNFIKKEVSP